MKRLHKGTLAAAAALLVGGVAQAGELPYGWEAAFIAAELADMSTTADINNHPGCHEINPILGRHPSDARIWGYGAGAIGVHMAVTYALVSSGAPRYLVTTWEAVTVGYETAVVARNYSLGYRFKF